MGPFYAGRTVNPNDVENAAWHFLCVARAESPEKARAALLPVTLLYSASRFKTRMIANPFSGPYGASAGPNVAKGVAHDRAAGNMLRLLEEVEAVSKKLRAQATN
jgi:hypothetical protein